MWYMCTHIHVVHMYGMLVGNTGTQVVYCLWSCTGGTHKIFLPSCNTVYLYRCVQLYGYYPGTDVLNTYVVKIVCLVPGNQYSFDVVFGFFNLPVFV